MTKLKQPCETCGHHFTKKQGKYFCSRKCQEKGRANRDPVVSTTHLIIPDTQIKAGVPNDHLQWIGRYIDDRYHGKQLTVIHLGDHWDMPSLSSFDRGKGKMEGRRYTADIDAGVRGMELLTGASWPGLRRVFLFGNHEDRITRAIDSDVQLDGLLSLDQCLTPGWERYEFRDPVNIDGIIYAHYFYNVNTGRPLAGENLETRLKTIGHSFVAGHQPGLKVAMRYVGGQQQIGIQAGSCYQHEEEYLGPQGNAFWRGIIVLNNVHDGSADLMTVSLDYLCKRYEGRPINEHRGVEL